MSYECMGLICKEMIVGIGKSAMMCKFIPIPIKEFIAIIDFSIISCRRTRLSRRDKTKITLHAIQDDYWSILSYNPEGCWMAILNKWLRRTVDLRQSLILSGWPDCPRQASDWGIMNFGSTFKSTSEALPLAICDVPQVFGVMNLNRQH